MSKLTRERVIMALRAAALERERNVPLKLVGRAARILGCSPTLVRTWIRKDPQVRAAKLEADEAWRATVEANLKRAKLLLSGRTRELLEAAERAEFNWNFFVDFALLEESGREISRKWRTK